MKYYIGHLVEGSVTKFYWDTITDITSRFNLSSMELKKRPPHISLKDPFRFDSIEVLEQFLETFTKTQKASEIKIEGIGHFGDKVIYLKVIPSKETLSTFKSFLNEFKKIEGVTWREFDNKDKVFHITLIRYKELEGKFDEVYEYLSTLKPSFTEPFDNLTLFRKEDGVTQVHKKFDLIK